MKPELFVDTSAWIALNVRRDSMHEAALSFASDRARAFQWITTNWVLAESATFLRKRAGHVSAVRFRRSALASTRLTVCAVSLDEELRAWSIFQDYDDKDFSVVDCASFAVMEQRGIGAAFAFDDHFRQYGFVALP